MKHHPEPEWRINLSSGRLWDPSGEYSAYQLLTGSFCRQTGAAVCFPQKSQEPMEDSLVQFVLRELSLFKLLKNILKITLVLSQS